MKLKARSSRRLGFSLRGLKSRIFKRKETAAASGSPFVAGGMSRFRALGAKKVAAREPAPVYVLVVTPKAEACFELRENGAVDVDRAALPQQGAVIYLFEGGDDERAKADLRIELPKKTSNRAAKEKVLEEINSKARMFRSPSYPGIMYGRDLRSLSAFGQNMVIPGPSLIDYLVPPTTQEAWIVPIVLSDSEGSTIAVIMCTVRPGDDGQASVQERLQLTKQPGVTTDTLITDFAKQAVRKNKAFEKPQVVQPTERDLISLAATLPFYPLENEVFGLPVSNLFKYGLVVAGAVAGISIAGNVVMGLEAGYLDLSATQAVSERDQLSRKVNETLNSRMRALATALSVDIGDTVKAAQSVWQPDALVTVDCNAMVCTLSLTTSVNRASLQGTVDTAGQLVSSTVDRESISAILMQAAPTGYRKKEVAITGDGNVVTVIFEHQNPDSPARRLLPH